MGLLPSPEKTKGLPDFSKSGNTVAIGSETLLTDPQIMTSPYDSYFIPPGLCLTHIPRKIAKGTNIFGEGNVGDVFEKFTEQHICNTYCKWFKLPVMHCSI
ncbi:hypothetical protein B0H14DRAFT_2589014 [Mycena olivaceomarginata]|nr:hypothetical protein B0H14DRAFT_2589014 [Mycena olivaceomarginata]